jgi:large subunit ribosomal protein L13
MKTLSAKANEVKRNWYIVDAEGQTLGRMASQIASRLRGKHKPIYTPHVDTGDYIVVINAAKVTVTGNKGLAKKYFHYSGYPSGMKETHFDKLIAEHPEQAIELAVKGMLPKNPLGRDMFRKLKVYAGDDHPHKAQQPQVLKV